jgi:hypothetical protein
MRLRHLVVVIPGIGGSVLQTSSGKPLWGQDRRRLAGSIIDPGRLSLSEQPDLVPVDVLRSITLTPPLPFTVHGYDTLISATAAAFSPVTVDTARPGVDPVPGADLLLFPYDFRLGVQSAAGRLKSTIDARLADLTGAARAGRVIVVAHSLGGLVARYWLGPLGGAPTAGR